MICPKCRSEVPSAALCCPKCNLQTELGRKRIEERRQLIQSAGGRRPRPRRPRTLTWPVSLILMAVSVLVFGLGSYLGMIYFTSSPPSTPGLKALERLRSLPSTQYKMTVEECLIERVERARANGRLVESEGWNIRKVDSNRAMISFSYEEKGGIHIRAEWLADLINLTFSPRNELASEISGK